MRRPTLAHTALALLAAAFIAAAGPALAAGALAVHMDQSVRISLRGAAQSVVVGNPTIADVSVVDARTILVLGKGYGVTNLVVLDAYGRTIFNREIVVSAPDTGRVSIWRGPTASTYACSPRCEREAGSQTAAPAPSSGTP